MLIVLYKEIVENDLFVNRDSLAIILLHPHMYENNINIKPVVVLLKKRPGLEVIKLEFILKLKIKP